MVLAGEKTSTAAPSASCSSTPSEKAAPLIFTMRSAMPVHADNPFLSHQRYDLLNLHGEPSLT
jgi:hypothetical protein